MASSEPPLNPFASPATDAPQQLFPGEYQVVGKSIVGGKEIALPCICVGCGAELPEESTAHRRKKTLSWAHPAIFLLILIQFFVFLIVYLIVRRTCKVQFSQCRRCTRRQRMAWLYFFLTMAAMFGSVTIGIIYDLPFAFWLVFPAIGGLAWFGIKANGRVQVRRFAHDRFELGSFDRTFLEKARQVVEDGGWPRY